MYEMRRVRIWRTLESLAASEQNAFIKDAPRIGIIKYLKLNRIRGMTKLVQNFIKIKIETEIEKLYIYTLNTKF